MEYPLISEYREAVLSAEDNFSELASLWPVLDSHGDLVMSSGNFAVVFKMRDEPKLSIFFTADFYGLLLRRGNAEYEKNPL